MLNRVTELGSRFPRLALGAAAALLAVAAVFGLSVAGQLSAGGFADPGAESTRATAVLHDYFGIGEVNLVYEVAAPGGADSGAALSEASRLIRGLYNEPGVNRVRSYWTEPPASAPSLRSKDGRRGLVLASVAGDNNQAAKRAGQITDSLLAQREPGVRVTAGGLAMAYHEVSERLTHDLVTAEAIAVPLTVLLLFWVFGSVVAALVPMAIGLMSVLGTLAILRGLTTVTEVSVYTLNLTTALGLALAIDYSLFIVSRYREEVRSGMDRPDAVRRAMATAGRTVLFSATTVALPLGALLLFPMPFLRSFAYAGIAVVVLTALSTLVVLPALLVLLGNRIDSLDLRVPLRRLFRRPSPGPSIVEHGFWYRVARAVMRRPVLIGVSTAAVLLVLAAPFLGVRFGYPDDRALPADASSHQLGNSIRSGYSVDPSSTLTAVLPGTDTGTGDYARRLSTIDGVTLVSGPDGAHQDGHRIGTGNPGAAGGSSYLVIRTHTDPLSTAGTTLLTKVRDTRGPGPSLVNGPTAENTDSVAAIGATLPLALGWIALTTFVVLFLFTGSVLLPLKALVLNVLSLSATFGAMVWIFQDGHLIELYGSTATGCLLATIPVLMFCLAFGTSMDYEVFLLSRIREHWLRTPRGPGDNERAVALGLGSTGRIVTAAAALMAIVFAALATSSVAFMQLLGTGMALAVLMDATLVRGVLVPAFMRLAGRANWWAPRPLARWHHRHGWTESVDVPATRGVPDAERVPGAAAGREVVETG